MIIYSGLITLEYNPATDILVASMPDITLFSTSEVRMALDVIVEHVHNYDIKKMLLDSSKSIVAVDNEEYNAITEKFGRDLMNTRLKKLARVASKDMQREEKSAQATANLKQKLDLPIAFGNFTTYDEAMGWLLEN